MNLNDAQQQKVSEWIAEGLKLSEIQKRLDSELGIRLTYMEARFLMDDLKLVPKDQPAPAAPEQPPAQPKAGTPPAPPAPLPATPPPPGPLAGPASKVSVTVDAVTKPGTLVSGNVTFSDGNSAAWYLDQMGRLGMSPKQPGYRPSPEDIEDFQFELQTELQKLGF